jgi:hypothetical protein
MKHYIISERTLLNLYRAEEELNALEAGGVDNWSWYDESLNSNLEDAKKDFNIPEDDETFDYEALAQKMLETGIKNGGVVPYEN